MISLLVDIILFVSLHANIIFSTKSCNAGARLDFPRAFLTDYSESSV
jgi:hypothetical protein